MKRIPAILLLGAVIAAFFSGCGEKPDDKSGKTKVTVGLAPIHLIVSKVGGDAVEAKLLLPEGRSPHDFAIGPRDVQAAAASAAFFSCGMPFENNVARSLSSHGGKVVDVTAGVKLIPMTEHHHHDGEEADHDAHDDDDDDHMHDSGHADPHVWLSLDNAAVIADNVCKALVAIAPEKKALFEANRDQLKRQYAETKRDILVKLADCKGRKFFVYHPAFGYFADMTGLKQEGIELNGREATPSRLVEVIREARKDNVKVIFVQPQFNPASAKALADAIGGRVAPLDPLAADISKNSRDMADTLAAGYAMENNAQ